MREYATGGVLRPFNTEARLAAGFDAEEFLVRPKPVDVHSEVDMKTQRFAIAIAFLALAACATPESPASTDAPSAKRAAGQEQLPLLAWRAFGNEPFWSDARGRRRWCSPRPTIRPGARSLGTHALQPDGGIALRRQDGDTAFSLDIAKDECSDGMSDNVRTDCGVPLRRHGLQVAAPKRLVKNHRTAR